MLFRDLLRLLADERPRVGWWVLLVALSVTFALVELVSSFAVLALMRVLLVADPASAFTVAGLALEPPQWIPQDQLTTALAAGLLALFVLRATLMVAVAYLGARLATMASVRIARRLLDGYLHLPYVQHTQRRSSDMVRDTFVSTERLHETATRPLAELATDAIVAIGLITALLLVDPAVTLVAGGLLTVATLAVQRRVRPALRRWSEQAQVATTESLESLQQSLAGIRDIRLLGQEARFLGQHDRERRRLARYRYLSVAARGFPRSLVELATVITIVVLLLVLSGRGDGSTDVLPVLGMFAYVGLRLQPVLNSLVTNVNDVRSSHGLIADLRRELDTVGPRTRAARPEPDAQGHRNDIALREVSFAYPAARDDRAPDRVLHAVTLDIPEGTFVGIVGPTGGGKSTLLDLIVGLLSPTEGAVMVGGHELGGSPHWWWRRIGVVSQAVYLAPATIRENVAFGAGDPTAPGVEQRIWESLRAAQLEGTVRALPDGLDTMVGDAGVRLSGGQRQRVALARAVFRDPPVIVLDEGTSALDEATEAGVMRALRDPEDDRRRTLIIVTHRASTVVDADGIIEVIGGRVTVRGR